MLYKGKFIDPNKLMPVTPLPSSTGLIYYLNLKDSNGKQINGLSDSDFWIPIKPNKESQLPAINEMTPYDWFDIKLIKNGKPIQD